jgi:hypothetical protein
MGFTRIRIVITHPGLEEIAQDVERFGARGLRAQEVEKLADGLRRPGIEVNIGYEQSGHLNRPI